MAQRPVLYAAFACLLAHGPGLADLALECFQALGQGRALNDEVRLSRGKARVRVTFTQLDVGLSLGLGLAFGFGSGSGFWLGLELKLRVTLGDGVTITAQARARIRAGVRIALVAQERAMWCCRPSG